jgi:flagellar biosynthesis protein FlhA
MEANSDNSCRFELVFGEAITPVIGEIQKLHDCSFKDLIQKEMLQTMGWFLSDFYIRESLSIGNFDCQLRVNGLVKAQTRILPDLNLAINSKPFIEKITGINAEEMFDYFFCRWIRKNKIYGAVKSGCSIFSAAGALEKWILYYVFSNSTELFAAGDLEKLINHSTWHPGAVKEALKNTRKEVILQTIKNLLWEGVALKPLEIILASIALYGGKDCQSNYLTIMVRKALSKQICLPFLDKEGFMSHITFDQKLEEWLEKQMHEDSELSLDPLVEKMFQLSIFSEIIKAKDQGYHPVVLTSKTLRKGIKNLIHKPMPYISVLSLSEISPGIKLRSVGCLKKTGFKQFMEL